MERFIEVDLADGLGDEFERLHHTLQNDTVPRWDRYDSRVQSAYEMARDVGQVNENMLHRADRYVFGIDDGEVVGFSSLRQTYSAAEAASGRAIELFHVVVDPDHQGEGHGHDLVEHSIDVAEEYADSREVDALYMKVQGRTTDAYKTVWEELKERGELNGASAFRRYCDQNGVDVEDLCEDNVPMERIADSMGFEQVDGDLFTTEYVREIED
jgi:GNAT superfamily N-acetyltransferase